jgi:DNA ligase-1
MTMLPKIYKRTNTGKIQEWTMEIQGNKFRTISGQENGKHVTSEWTTCEGKNLGKKNATSPAEQALAEAYAKRKKKLEKEYKESKTDIDNIVFRSPMLAESMNDMPDFAYPVYVQPKLDGVRCIATKDGLFTRNGKVIASCPHIIERLQPLFIEEPELEIDGELYNHELKENFDELVSIVKQMKPSAQDLEKAAKHMQYYVYDIRDTGSIFSERSKRLSKLVRSIKSKKVIFLETIEIVDKTELDDIYADFLEEGYEGQMIRANTPYEFKRTYSLLKRKEFITDEFEVVDVIEGKGNRSGMAGKIVIKLHEPTIDGETTCESSLVGGVDFYKRMLIEKENIRGKQATIMFQNYTPKKSLRFPKMLTIRDYE